MFLNRFFLEKDLRACNCIDTHWLDVSVSTREGPVSGNQEAAQIFIKYMYDIVLEISFLDINSQNWSNVGHMRLRQKSFKI